MASPPLFSDREKIIKEHFASVIVNCHGNVLVPAGAQGIGHASAEKQPHSAPKKEGSP
jgi:hypothetical protein